MFNGKRHITDTIPPMPRNRSSKLIVAKTVITTHINADFDAFSSMLAAKKLYPDACVVFPGAQEPSLRDFFVQSMAYMYDIVRVRDIDPQSVERLVLVDTRQASRIGWFAKIAACPGIEIHIYDHHPPTPDDLAGNFELIEMTGANITLMIRLLRERQIHITPEEATIMALGLYEDTGSFMFPSTTEQDYLAGSYLLSAGANLNVVSNMVTREMRPEQVSILNELIQGVTHHTINAVDVALTTVSSETYVPDLSVLVHKLRDIENLDVVFALASMENRIYMVARSRLPEVDVGRVAMALGGGGHASAASAVVKNQTLIQVKEELFTLLDQAINPTRTARHFMSSPVIHVAPEVSLRDANELLTRYNINVLVIMKADELLGTISRQVIEKALFHKLDRVSVREYMNSEIVTVPESASLAEIQEKIIENKQRLLPVVENDRTIGVITRTDLLNVLVSDRARIPEIKPGLLEGTHARERNIAKLIRERLRPQTLQLLKTIGELAQAAGFHAYAVGGFVRDLLLSQKDLDIDIVVEGDGIELAKALAQRVGGRVRSHSKFRTAVVIFPDGAKIDVATARLEYYESPGALPTVEKGSLKLDLYRRDFSINTLAIALDPQRFGVLVDYFGAQKDLNRKVIQVLHNISFVEDPTRVFRAVRFEQRFGFKIGKLTAGLIENAVRMDFFRELSGHRLFSELRLILEEDRPLMALKRLNEFGLLRVIHPKLSMDAGLEELLSSVEQVLAWHNLLFLEDSCKKWLVYLLMILKLLGREVGEEICGRLEVFDRFTRILVDERIDADTCLAWMGEQKRLNNSHIYRKLRPFNTEVVLYMMASTKNESIRRAFSQYFTKLRTTVTFLTGNDLKAMGFMPGPTYRKILGSLLNARLNGRLSTREDEVQFVRKYWNKKRA